LASISKVVCIFAKYLKQTIKMTQIILQIDDMSILPEIERTLGLLKGVKFQTITDIPVNETVKAIERARAGKVTRYKSSAEMFDALSK